MIVFDRIAASKEKIRKNEIKKTRKRLTIDQKRNILLTNEINRSISLENESAL